MSEPQRTRSSGSIGLRLEITLSVFASAVFVVLWAYVAAAVFTNTTLLTDTWAWLNGLGAVPAAFVWIMGLPIAVFLWAWQADLGPLIMGLVMIGLMVWSTVAWSGLVRALRRR